MTNILALLASLAAGNVFITRPRPRTPVVEVRDALTGQALEGVRVRFRNEWASARTDSNGVAMLRCRVGPYAEVRTHLQGYRLSNCWLWQTVKDTFYFSCYLSRWAERTVTGQVIANSTGLPVAGALAKLGRQSVQTDVAGRFTLRGTYRGRTDLQVRYPGHPNITRTLTAGNGDTLRVRVVLFDTAATGGITGRVTDARDGEAIADSHITVEGTSMSCTTDKNGVFTIDGMPPGDYRIIVCALGHDDSQRWISVTQGPPVLHDCSLEPSIILIDY